MAQSDRSRPPAVLHGIGGAEAETLRGRARRLGLSFIPHVHLGPGAASEIEAVENGRVAMSAARDLYIAPEEDAMARAAHLLNMHPEVRRRIVVSTRTAIRAALRVAGARRYLAEALVKVETVDPWLSARTTFTMPQRVIGVLGAFALAAALFLERVAALAVVELLAALFFTSLAVIRIIAATKTPHRLPAPAIPKETGRERPIYTVLVPLRHEAHMVPQLIDGLDRIVWPRERLDIKLVIDEDDTATLGAARSLAREPPYEIVVVPPGGPQTKPMALQYALSFARGAFVTVYDAEDRPHPGQIAEAYATFQRGSRRLACLQAPLAIDDPDKTWVSRLFAIEYSALFDGLLPALAALGLPLPLGGTSNHFRRSALEDVGGWDPWNVTEDADLGIRLARFGYTTATITLPTVEEAPSALGPWMRQRTRWLKGWLQTWLVHTRRPVKLWRELGTRRTLGFNALGLGMIVSALAHPLFLATPFLLLIDPGRLWSNGGILIAVLAALSLFNLAAGYAAMWTLSAKTLALRGRSRLIPSLWLLPFYWLLMAAACVAAAVQLLWRPHRWDKTPHTGRARGTRSAAPVRRRIEPALPAADLRSRRA